MVLFLMSHPPSLWQVNKCLIQCISRCNGGGKKKACLYSSSRLLCSEALQACRAVAAGVWAVPSLMAVTFLSSSCWLHCTAADGACDSRHIVSAPVRTRWTLTLHTLAVNRHTYVLPSHPLPPPHWCSHSDSRHTLTFCTTTSTSRSFRPLLTHGELRPIV